MAQDLPPVPYRGPIADQNGIVTPVWADWFKKLLDRVGGHIVTYALDELWTYIQNRIVKPGTITAFGAASAPTGYLACDGAAVSRATYAALFAIIGTTWGAGDGSTTFNVPDLRGKFIVGKAAAGTFATLAGAGGAETAALPNHAHSVNLTTGTESGTATVAAGAVTVAGANHTHAVSGNTGNPTTNPTIATLPPYAVVSWVIKT